MTLKGLIIFFALAVPLASSFGLCDIFNVINSWGPCTGQCEHDWTGDGQVDLRDILVVINGWDGDPSCDKTVPPSMDGWSVTTSPMQAALCVGEDLTLTTTIDFQLSAPTRNFVVQADAPAQAAVVQTINLVHTGSSGAKWTQNNCAIFTNDVYSYFSCEDGPEIQDGDRMVLTYVLRTLDTKFGVFPSEVTTFPPVQLAAPVQIDMRCGRTTLAPTTTAPQTSAPPFSWEASFVSGPDQVCGATPAVYTFRVDSIGVGQPFIVGSEFIRNEGLIYSDITKSASATGLDCTLFDSTSFACTGLVTESFTISFTLTRSGAKLNGSAQISVVTGFTNSNNQDRFTTKDISYGPNC